MSTSRKLWVVASSVLGALAVASLGFTAAAGDDEPKGRAQLRNAAGAPVGVVKLTQEEDQVLVRAVVRGLPAGFHGFHVHAVGECVPPFTSAGGHYNPGGAGHGSHAGDMPLLLVNNDGTAQLRFPTDRFTVAQLFDADGSAIIVHAAADNYANIPTRYHSHTENTFGPDSATLATGDAGGRLACGVVD
jgi:superoxide dismutase, Cu-Zn family